MNIREKTHRLPKELYRGRISVAFTLCLRTDREPFMSNAIMGVFVTMLASSSEQHGCIVPAYCFMPDHQHILVTGISDAADTLKMITAYKQSTGFWLSKNLPAVVWQKDFFDHVIRADEKTATHVRYILDNPVRKGLVKNWQDYPYQGSVGCLQEDILFGIM